VVSISKVHLLLIFFDHMFVDEHKKFLVIFKMTKCFDLHCYFNEIVSLPGQSDKRVQQAIYRKLQQLPEEEQDVLLTKFRGSDNSNQARGLREQNEFLMMLIRAHCESKQSRHVHDTAENRLVLTTRYFWPITLRSKWRFHLLPLSAEPSAEQGDIGKAPAPHLR